MAAEAIPATPLLEVRGLCKTFASRGLLGPPRLVPAAREVAFRLGRGETIALVGGSGSGKTTVARLVVGLERPDAGTVLLDGQPVPGVTDGHVPLGYRRRVQMVFQDPFGSLNPVHDILHHLARPLLRHRRALAREVRACALKLLQAVGLDPAEEFIDRFPHQLSGGQRQRVAIARALTVEPDVLFADEPTSMLDVSIRMGILQLLSRLQRERGMGIVLITHDLASARFLADRILVFHEGKVVEEGPSAQVIDSPRHPYTQRLLGAVAGHRPPPAVPIPV
jgi:ABC-type glutathione transport system ATPase component